MMTLTIDDRRLVLIQGDITIQTTDAIVNAANSSLFGEGGVDNTIQRRGGAAILQECRQIRAQQYPNGLPTGEAVITGGGLLPARYVIHTVGPIWRGGLRDEDRILRSAYEHSLALAYEFSLTSIAFPSISTGICGFPIERAAPIALSAMIDHLRSAKAPSSIIMTLLYSHDLRVYCQALRRLVAVLNIPTAVLA